MTYCVAMLLDTGMVFLSDSRTSAGVDQISTFRKTTVFQRPGDRVMVVQSAGNLAITQAVTTVLREDLEAPDSGANLFNLPQHVRSSSCIGEALREVHGRDAQTLKEFGVDFNAEPDPRRSDPGRNAAAVQHLLGGQFHRGAHRKPAISRSASPSTANRSSTASIRRSSSLNEAAKCALVSMDSTIRSNLSVGLPLDLVHRSGATSSRSPVTSASTPTTSTSRSIR